MSGKRVAEFRDRFVELIDASPKSRTTIAQEFGVAKQTISAWITGQSSPRMPVVTALAEYFDVNPDWLLGFDVPKMSESEFKKQSAVYKTKIDELDLNQSPTAKIISAGVSRMPLDKQKKALQMMQLAFDEYADFFKEETQNDDT